MHNNMMGLNRIVSQSYANGISVVLLMTAILGPLLAGPMIAGSHLFIFRILAIFLLPLLFIIVLKQNSSKIQISGEEILFYIFSIYLIASLSLTQSVSNALSSSSVVILPIVTGIIIAASIRGRASLKHLLGVLTILLFISLLIAMWELATGQHLPTSGISDLPDRFSHNMSAWYYNQNDFSAFVAILSPLLLIKLLHGNRIQKLLSISAFFIIYIIMYQQNPRGAILGMIVSTVVCVFIFFFRQPISSVRNQVSTLLSVAPFIGSLVTVGTVVLVSDTFLLGNQSTLVRWRLFDLSVDIAGSTIIGVGLGNFQMAVQQSLINTFGIRSPHNWLTWLLAVTGIPGTVLFLLLLGSLLRQHFINYLENTDPISLAIIGIVISFSIAGTGPSNILHMELIWILLGILAASTRIINVKSSGRISL